MKKLRKQNGETLIESLISVLICVIAMGMLAASLTASARINHQNRTVDKKYTEDLKYAEGFLVDGEHAVEEVTITFTKEGGTAITELTDVYYVELYGGADGSFSAYKEVKKR